MKKFAFFYVGEVLQKIVFSEILYIEGDEDYVLIHLSGSKNSVRVHISMKRISEILTPEFFRIHKSFIVQIDKIEFIENLQLSIDGRQRWLPISEPNKKELLEKINYVQGTYQRKKYQKSDSSFLLNN